MSASKKSRTATGQRPIAGELLTREKLKILSARVKAELVAKKAAPGGSSGNWKRVQLGLFILLDRFAGDESKPLEGGIDLSTFDKAPIYFNAVLRDLDYGAALFQVPGASDHYALHWIFDPQRGSSANLGVGDKHADAGPKPGESLQASARVQPDSPSPRRTAPSGAMTLEGFLTSSPHRYWPKQTDIDDRLLYEPEELLDQIASMLAATRCCLIRGQSGSGKTALAIAFAVRWKAKQQAAADRGPSAVWYLDVQATKADQWATQLRGGAFEKSDLILIDNAQLGADAVTQFTTEWSSLEKSARPLLIVNCFSRAMETVMVPTSEDFHEIFEAMDSVLDLSASEIWDGIVRRFSDFLVRSDPTRWSPVADDLDDVEHRKRLLELCGRNLVQTRALLEAWQAARGRLIEVHPQAAKRLLAEKYLTPAVEVPSTRRDAFAEIMAELCVLQSFEIPISQSVLPAFLGSSQEDLLKTGLLCKVPGKGFGEFGSRRALDLHPQSAQIVAQGFVAGTVGEQGTTSGFDGFCYRALRRYLMLRPANVIEVFRRLHRLGATTIGRNLQRDPELKDGLVEAMRDRPFNEQLLFAHIALRHGQDGEQILQNIVGDLTAEQVREKIGTIPIRRFTLSLWMLQKLMPNRLAEYDGILKPAAVKDLAAEVVAPPVQAWISRINRLMVVLPQPDAQAILEEANRLVPTRGVAGGWHCGSGALRNRDVITTMARCNALRRWAPSLYHVYLDAVREQLISSCRGVRPGLKLQRIARLGKPLGNNTVREMLRTEGEDSLVECFEQMPLKKLGDFLERKLYIPEVSGAYDRYRHAEFRSRLNSEPLEDVTVFLRRIGRVHQYGPALAADALLQIADLSIFQRLTSAKAGAICALISLMFDLDRERLLSLSTNSEFCRALAGCADDEKIEDLAQLFGTLANCLPDHLCSIIANDGYTFEPAVIAQRLRGRLAEDPCATFGAVEHFARCSEYADVVRRMRDLGAEIDEAKIGLMIRKAMRGASTVKQAAIICGAYRVWPDEALHWLKEGLGSRVEASKFRKNMIAKSATLFSMADRELIARACRLIDCAYSISAGT